MHACELEAGVSVTTSDLAAQVARAHAAHTPLRIVGGASWLDANRPCEGEPLNVGEYAGIVEYVPGDLTLTARAGTTLAELHRRTAEHGQWLALDPSANERATIGATIATASDGPLAISMGRVRDLVLGVECITGSGEITRAGGRVVKNVAGFDLVRLHTGAWGTLGVITEVTVRLRARPDVDRAFVIAGDSRASLESRLAPLADLPIAPLALELLSSALAGTLGLHDGKCLLVRLAGNEDRVHAQAQALHALGDVREVPVSTFDALSAIEPPNALAVRVSHMPTLFASAWRHVAEHLDAHEYWQPLMRGSVTRGVIRVLIPFEQSATEYFAAHALSRGADGTTERTTAHAADRASTFVRRIAPLGAHAAWERLPAEWWPFVDSPVNDRLSIGLRRALDPAHIMNRGLLGEAVA
jgi:glycolate oxidase FAD binding subunit